MKKVVDTKKSKVAVKELDPTIRTIAEHYGFTIEWDVILEKWVICHEDSHCCFYWDSNHDLAYFLDDLKEFFYDIGTERSCW